jgi:hypothetical protein
MASNDLIVNPTAFITLMAALSVGVERAVETIKGFVPYLNEPISDPKKDGVRGAIVRIIAAICGGIAAAGVQSQVAATAPILSASNIGFASYVILGLLTSGGSAFWNHILDLLQKLKSPKPAPPAGAAAAATAGGK